MENVLLELIEGIVEALVGGVGSTLEGELRAAAIDGMLLDEVPTGNKLWRVSEADTYKLSSSAGYIQRG